MTSTRQRWRVRLSAAAEADYKNILIWSADNFGAAQARIYAETVTLALEALMEGPNVAGSRRREDIARDMMTLHVARKGRKARHMVIYRSLGNDRPPTIDVLRFLHDSMDVVRHVQTGPII